MPTRQFDDLRRHPEATAGRRPSGRCPLRAGWTMVEVIVVVTMMSILISISIPIFDRALEQSRGDIAGANLRAVWTAERLYWLEYHTYTADLSALQSAGLLDPTVVSATTVYVYQVPSAGSSSFSATATRTGSQSWAGTLTMDQTGVLSGVIQGTARPTIVPGFQ